MDSKSSRSRRRAGTRPPTPELAEAGGDDLPHYLGHRQRLRERFLNGGRDALPDYELLELLLFMAIPRVDTKPLAKELIDKFGSFGDLIASPVQKLRDAKVSENTIAALKVVEAAALRLAKARVMGKPALSSWEALLDYCAMEMSRGQTEQFRILFLDRKNVLIAD